MTIEQRPGLSRLINPSIAAPWEYRWSVIRPFLLVGLPVVTLFAEWGLFLAWISNRPDVALIGVAIAFFPVVAPFLFLVILFQILGLVFKVFGRGKTHANPTVVFNDDEILYGAYEISVKWTAIDIFRFEPVASAPGMTKLSLWSSTRPGRKRVVYQIVIGHPAQVRELIDYLHSRQARGFFAYTVAVLDRAAPLLEPRPSFLSGLAGAAGFVAFINGSLMLITAFDQLKLERFPKYRQLIGNHASSSAEFHLYCFNVGAVILIIGIWLMIRYKREEKRVRGAHGLSRNALVCQVPEKRLCK